MTEPGSRINYEFGKFRLDLQQRLLLSSADGRPVVLSPRLFDTLLYFVERRGELLDKATLMKAIWPNIVVEENNLNQNISALRRVLGETPGEHRFIVTEPGRGYRFVADVRTVTTQPETPQRPGSVDVTHHSTFAATRRADALHRSIAVLPFVNLTRDIDKEYFGDGLAEELLHVLAGVQGLRVPARTSSFAYKGRNTDVRQIAQDLDVSTVLEGSVRSAGELIRVTVQLVDGRTGYHLWSESYERKFEDLFKLQDELAAAIVRALDLGPALPHVLPLSHVPPSADIEAYHLYLQARALLARQQQQDFPRIRSMLDSAVSRDPGFARAHATLAMYHFVSVLEFFSGPEALVDAERCALRALELDPAIGEALIVLAQVHTQRGDWLMAAKYYESALASAPGEGSTHAVYALFRGCAGHLRMALREAMEAARCAPAAPVFAGNVAAWSSILGMDADAVRFADVGIALGLPITNPPMPMVFANTTYRAGEFDKAAKYVTQALPPKARLAGGAQVIESIYAALADAGDKKAAVEALRSLRERAGGPDGMGSSLMLVLAMNWLTMLGDLDAAYAVANEGLDHLQRVGTIGASWGGLWLPEMRSFRQDPRFQAFVTRLGLMTYWEQYGPPDDCELRDGKLICR